jgi:hypothetical protein
MARLIRKYGTEATRTEERLRTSLARARIYDGPEPAYEAAALANLLDAVQVARA